MDDVQMRPYQSINSEKRNLAIEKKQKKLKDRKKGVKLLISEKLYPILKGHPVFVRMNILLEPCEEYFFLKPGVPLEVQYHNLCRYAFILSMADPSIPLPNKELRKRVHNALNTSEWKEKGKSIGGVWKETTIMMPWIRLQPAPRASSDDYQKAMEKIIQLQGMIFFSQLGKFKGMRSRGREILRIVCAYVASSLIKKTLDEEPNRSLSEWGLDLNECPFEISSINDICNRIGKGKSIRSTFYKYLHFLVDDDMYEFMHGQDQFNFFVETFYDVDKMKRDSWKSSISKSKNGP